MQQNKLAGLIAQYNISGELAKDVLCLAEKTARDLAASSGKSVESARATVLVVTKGKL